MHLKIHTDGASLGNPGPAAIGIVVKEEKGKKIREFSQYIGVATNNQAEYQAVIIALKVATKFKATELTLYLDSELIARQLTGQYQVKSPSLKSLYLETCQLKQNFKKLTVIIISREENKEAHDLAWSALKRLRQCNV